MSTATSDYLNKGFIVPDTTKNDQTLPSESIQRSIQFQLKNVLPNQLPVLKVLASSCPIFSFKSKLESGIYLISFCEKLTKQQFILVLLQNNSTIIHNLLECATQLPQMNDLIRDLAIDNAMDCSSLVILAQYKSFASFHSLFLSSIESKKCSKEFQTSVFILFNSSIPIHSNDYQQTVSYVRENNYFLDSNFDFLISKCSPAEVQLFFKWIDSKQFSKTNDDALKQKGAFASVMYEELVTQYCPPYQSVGTSTTSIVLTALALIQLIVIFVLWIKTFKAINKDHSNQQ